MTSLTVQHGVCNVSRLCARRPGRVGHGVHNTGDDARLAGHVAPMDGQLLKQEHLGQRRTSMSRLRIVA